MVYCKWVVFPHRYRKCSNVTLLGEARPICLTFCHPHNVCLDFYSAYRFPISCQKDGYYLSLQYILQLLVTLLAYCLFYSNRARARLPLSFYVALSLSMSYLPHLFFRLFFFFCTGSTSTMMYSVTPLQ